MCIPLRSIERTDPLGRTLALPPPFNATTLPAGWLPAPVRPAIVLACPPTEVWPAEPMRLVLAVCPAPLPGWPVEPAWPVGVCAVLGRPAMPPRLLELVWPAAGECPAAPLWPLLERLGELC